MAKIIKKKFFDVEVPLLNEKYEALGNAVTDLDNKSLKIDATRKLRGKGVDLIFTIKLIEGKAVAVPKKIFLLPSFISHMMHAGADYVEDSFAAQTQESEVIIKPFLITRKKVSRAVRRTLRNSARNWLIDYLKTKDDNDVFQEILSNQLQKPLSIRLKKIYPLGVCEIRWFEIKKLLAKKQKKEEKIIEEIEIKKEETEKGNIEEVKEEIKENIEISSAEENAEKSKKKNKKVKTE